MGALSVVDILSVPHDAHQWQATACVLCLLAVPTLSHQNHNIWVSKVQAVLKQKRFMELVSSQILNFHFSRQENLGLNLFVRLGGQLGWAPAVS